MSTPKTPKRYKLDTSKITAPSQAVYAISENVAMYIGYIATEYTRLEASMLCVFRVLMRMEDRDAASLAYHAIKSVRARSDLMRQVLEKSSSHKMTPVIYDSILTEFDRITSLRNVYVHGVWTTASDGTAFLERSDGDWCSAFEAKPVKISDLENLLKSMSKLGKTIKDVTYPVLYALQQRCEESLKRDGEPLTSIHRLTDHIEN